MWFRLVLENNEAERDFIMIFSCPFFIIFFLICYVLLEKCKKTTRPFLLPCTLRADELMRCFAFHFQKAHLSAHWIESIQQFRNILCANFHFTNKQLNSTSASVRVTALVLQTEHQKKTQGLTVLSFSRERAMSYSILYEYNWKFVCKIVSCFQHINSFLGWSMPWIGFSVLKQRNFQVINPDLILGARYTSVSENHVNSRFWETELILCHLRALKG